MAVRTVSSVVEQLKTNTYGTVYNQVSPADRTMVYRLVGSYEYRKSLELLDSLINNSSQEEIEIYNDIIKSRPEFSVYVLKSSLNNQKHSPAVRVTDGYEKKLGLFWLMALARIEVGGVLSAYSDVQRPFEILRPSAREMPAYKSLIKTDAAVHFRALTIDPQYAKVARDSSKQPDSNTMAYLRRLKLVSDLVATARRIDLGGNYPTKGQLAKLAQNRKHAAIQVANFERLMVASGKTSRYDPWLTQLEKETNRLYAYLMKTQRILVGTSTSVRQRQDTRYHFLGKCCDFAGVARRAFEK